MESSEQVAWETVAARLSLALEDVNRIPRQSEDRLRVQDHLHTTLGAVRLILGCVYPQEGG